MRLTWSSAAGCGQLAQVHHFGLVADPHKENCAMYFQPGVMPVAHVVKVIMTLRVLKTTSGCPGYLTCLRVLKKVTFGCPLSDHLEASFRRASEVWWVLPWMTTRRGSTSAGDFSRAHRVQRAPGGFSVWASASFWERPRSDSTWF